MQGYEQKQYALEDRNYAERDTDTYSMKKVANFFKNLLTFTYFYDIIRVYQKRGND